MGSICSKPDWLKVRYSPTSGNVNNVKLIIEKNNLHSVCQSAHCPNCQECWGNGTATFMVLGDECTRNCRFCAVKTNPRPKTPDTTEPERLAKAIEELKLKYVVLTSVDRDDLPDYGAGRFAECIKKIKESNPTILVEALVPDFNNDKLAIATIVGSGVDVLGHNIETVERLTPKVRDARAGYRKSLEVLKAFKGLFDSSLSKGKNPWEKALSPEYKTQNPELKTMCPSSTSSRWNSHSIKTKSSIMLGLGETKDEIVNTMKDLLESKVDILTLGQYLQPTKKQLPIERYVTPDEFKEFEEIGRSLGFKAVFAGPFVRSSYRAAELFLLKSKP